MIVSSGFRGFGSGRLSRMGRSQRLQMDGYGATFRGFGAFGADANTNPTWVFDDSGNVTVDSGSSTSTTDWGTTAAGIGTGLEGILTGLARLMGSTGSNPSTQPVGGGGGGGGGGGLTISPMMLIGGAALAIGAVLLINNSKK